MGVGGSPGKLVMFLGRATGHSNGRDVHDAAFRLASGCRRAYPSSESNARMFICTAIAKGCMHAENGRDTQYKAKAQSVPSRRDDPVGGQHATIMLINPCEKLLGTHR